MKIVLATLIGVAIGVVGGCQIAYRQAVDADAAIWVYPSDASEHSPSKGNWLPTLQWRPASTLKAPVIRQKDFQPFEDSGPIG